MQQLFGIESQQICSLYAATSQPFDCINSEQVIGMLKSLRNYKQLSCSSTQLYKQDAVKVLNLNITCTDCCRGTTISSRKQSEIKRLEFYSESIIQYFYFQSSQFVFIKLYLNYFLNIKLGYICSKC